MDGNWTMTKKIIFSIYIDIPEDRLDNPGGYDWKTGEQKTTDKSLKVKNSFAEYSNELESRQRAYAETIGSHYVLHEYDQEYLNFCQMFKGEFPQISEYDIVNFYKHWLMKVHAENYDQVCYLDFDVIPNTNEDIFEAHDNDKFACAEQNDDAFWGKNCKADAYNTCIRNPASKYWNCHAMLMEEGFDPDTDVFNTAIMIATAEQIKKLDYFGDFKEVLNLMTELKNDEYSMYPFQIQRIFNYDNETVFAYKRVINGIEVDYIDELWHNRLTRAHHDINPEAKMYHVIHKRFDLVLL